MRMHIAVPEVEQSSAQIEQLSEADQKWSHSQRHVQGFKFNNIHPNPPNQKTSKLSIRKTVQKLLEEINSCIALLEE
jgi:hypothetical protein